MPENSNIVYLDNEATIDTNLEDLVAEIENLKDKVITLESEKASQIDVTASISNLTTTHNSDINGINVQITNLNNGINSIKNDLNLPNREVVHKEFIFPYSEVQIFYVFTALKDGLYLFLEEFMPLIFLGFVFLL